MKSTFYRQLDLPILKQAESGMPISELRREHNMGNSIIL